MPPFLSTPGSPHYSRLGISFASLFTLALPSRVHVCEKCNFSRHQQLLANLLQHRDTRHNHHAHIEALYCERVILSPRRPQKEPQACIRNELSLRLSSPLQPPPLGDLLVRLLHSSTTEQLSDIAHLPRGRCKELYAN